MIIRNPLLGAMINFLLFGSADICVGRILRGIVKMMVFVVFIVGGGLIVDAVRPQWLSNAASLVLLLAYAIYSISDGYHTIVRR
ncbi:MAG: hypothetical protein U0175_36560 [Caldilineaceae bacterium]